MTDPQPQHRTISIDAGLLRALGKLILALLGLYLLVRLFPYLSNVLVLVLISVLLTAIFGPFVDVLERWSVPRSLGSLIILLMVLMIVGLAFRFLIPVVREQAVSIQQLVQSQQPAELMAKLEAWIESQVPVPGDIAISEQIDLPSRLNSFVGGFVSSTVTMLLNMVGVVTSLFIVLVITFLMMKDRRKLKRGIISLVPNRYFEPALNLFDKVETQLSNYIRGQLLDALIIGILSVIGLWILDIKYFVFIGMIAGIANLIPYIGPVVGAIPAMLVSLINNPGEPVMLLYIAIMFAIVQLIDNSVVSPTVMSKSVNMHPISVILIVIIGGNLMGAFGMLIAVPAAGIIKVTLEQIHWAMKHYKVI